MSPRDRVDNLAGVYTDMREWAEEVERLGYVHVAPPGLPVWGPTGEDVSTTGSGQELRDLKASTAAAIGRIRHLL